MTEIVAAIGLVLTVAILLMLWWLINATFGTRQDMGGQATALNLLQQQLDALRTTQDNTAANLQKALQTGQSSLASSFQAQQQTLHRLNSQMGELQGTHKQLVQVGSEIRKLQDILSSPKLRGQMGEWSLETILTTVLPQESIRLQHHFRDGKIVDALVQLPEYSIPIDAKFPLPSFQRMTTCTEKKERRQLRKQLLKDVTIHIDKIASDYIRPAEGTLDFALMYIPAENVYYETVIKLCTDTLDLSQYALEHKVVPVSPNLLYTYLMTVAMGLHGLQIEKQAGQIRQNLQKLNADFQSLVAGWDTLGSHLRNASGKYEDTQKRLDRFGVHLEQIQGDNPDKAN